MCDICGSQYDEDNECETTLVLREWLEINDACKICKKRGCINCLNVCHSCCNEGDLNDDMGICINCSQTYKLKQICEYHDWFVCDQHINEDCGECHANRNYCKKMEWF